MTNGWTGGQYSLFRVVFGLYLLGWAIGLIDFADYLNTTVVFLAAAAAAFLIVGWCDRSAAIGLAAWMSFQADLPALLNTDLDARRWLNAASTLIPALVLLVHASLPAAPYGSIAARSRPDPAGEWRFRPAIYIATWCAMATGYSVVGLIMLRSDPAWRNGDALAELIISSGRTAHLGELLRMATWCVLGACLSFAMLAAVSRLRPWLWAIMLLIQLGLGIGLELHNLAGALLMLHLLTFDPAWIAPRPPAAEEDAKATDPYDQPDSEMIYYDGHCGLCHQSVRFVLSEDRSANTFRFAALQSRAFETSVPPAGRKDLPDSVVVKAADGTLRCRSDGALYVGARLGGLWRVLAMILHLLPRSLCDALYDKIAAVRYGLFKQPEKLCPIVPKTLMQRFEM